MRGARPERALDRLVRPALPLRGGRVLLACSGGPDSVALAALLDRLAARRRLELVLAHVNHGARPSAGQDECVVLSVAARLGRPVRVARPPRRPRRRGAPARARATPRSRSWRRELGAARGGHRAHRRGPDRDGAAGALPRHRARGLAGMPVRRPLAAGVELVRPLLRVTHAELATELRRSGLPYALDPTNAERALPPQRAARRRWRRCGPSSRGLDRAVARCAAIVRDDLAGTDRARARRALRARLRARGALRDVTFARLEAALDERGED